MILKIVKVFAGYYFFLKKKVLHLFEKVVLLFDVDYIVNGLGCLVARVPMSSISSNLVLHDMTT